MLLRSLHGLKAVSPLIPGVVALSIPLIFPVNGVFAFLGLCALMAGHRLIHHTNMMSEYANHGWCMVTTGIFGVLYFTYMLWSPHAVGIGSITYTWFGFLAFAPIFLTAAICQPEPEFQVAIQRG